LFFRHQTVTSWPKVFREETRRSYHDFGFATAFPLERITRLGN